MEKIKPKKNKPLRIAIYLIVLFVMTCVGLGAAVIYHAIAETSYESRAVFRVDVGTIPEPLATLDFSQTTEARHDQLMTQANIIQTCLTKSRLTELRTFENTLEELIVAEVQDNLMVAQNSDEPTLYTASFRCSRPDDAQTVLNNLIETYFTYLTTQEEQTVEVYEVELKSSLELVQDEWEAAEKSGKTEGVSWDRLQQRLDDSKQKIVELKLSLGQDRRNIVTTKQILQNATYGEVVWPILPLILLVGAASGFGFGLLLIMLWFFLDGLS